MCCCLSSPKDIACTLFRIAFGAGLIVFGIAHYMNIGGFVGMVSQDLGALSILGKLWAYVLPALQIVGGALLIGKVRLDIAAWCIGIALASIFVGMPLKAVLGNADLGEMASMSHNTLIWLIAYVLIIKCVSGCKEKDGGCCSSKQEHVHEEKESGCCRHAG